MDGRVLAQAQQPMTGEYRQMTRNRKRCRACGKLLADGDRFVSTVWISDQACEMWSHSYRRIKRRWFHEYCYQNTPYKG